MFTEDHLREKLRKIEALYAAAATAGEKSAAGAAAERIRRRFEAASRVEEAHEYRFSIPDEWSRQLFIALCRRYGVRPFRYRRMHRQTVVVRAPATFVDQILWPEFEELSGALAAHLQEITQKIIHDEIYASAQDAEVVSEQQRLL
jgi:hypothetical protein